MKLPKSLIQPHIPSNPAACQVLRKDACRVLRRVAGDLALRQRDYTILARRRPHHQAEVFTLQSVSLCVQIEHSTARSTALMSFRTCRGRQDHTGGRDNAVSLESFGSKEGYASLLGALRVVAGRRS
ncbi:hypothetical protein [Cupriavidus sp. WS]|uniref:hypothetical protein n=1 Tax=Cupriavidus sp. WS TaxID=1312922 RepID=UPI0004901FAB|nr:hypothetical protein [Cupriavidus sp. WS]